MAEQNLQLAHNLIRLIVLLSERQVNQVGHDRDRVDALAECYVVEPRLQERIHVTRRAQIHQSDPLLLYFPVLRHRYCYLLLLDGRALLARPCRRLRLLVVLNFHLL